MKKKLKPYRFSLQYPKPVPADSTQDIIDLATSGLFSRYAAEDVVLKLESKLASFFGVKHAVTCSSGTAAIHGVLTALNLPVGSEVITTPVTDVGVVLPIIYQNLIPVFADIDRETFNLDPISVERLITPKTSAIIAVHLAGNPAPLDELKRIARKHRIVLIEDCSQAHGAEYGGRPVGSIGDISIASLQQSKHITSGEGGVMLTNDAKMAYTLKLAVDKGWTRERDLAERRYEFLALNYRYTAIQAAFVLPQMKRINGLLAHKRKLADGLTSRIAKLGGAIGIQRVLPGARHSYYSFPTYINGDRRLRDELLTVLEREFAVKCAVGYANPVPLYLCTAALEDPVKNGRGLLYSSRKYPAGTCPVAEDLLSRSFLLPFNEQFTSSDMDEMIGRLGQALAKVGVGKVPARIA